MCVPTFLREPDSDDVADETGYGVVHAGHPQMVRVVVERPSPCVPRHRAFNCPHCLPQLPRVLHCFIFGAPVLNEVVSRSVWRVGGRGFPGETESRLVLVHS